MGARGTAECRKARAVFLLRGESVTTRLLAIVFLAPVLAWANPYKESLTDATEALFTQLMSEQR